MHTLLKVLLYILIGAYSLVLSQTGDRVLQAREARLNAIDDRLNPLREDRMTSSLAGVTAVGRDVQLVDPKAKIVAFTLLEAVKKFYKKNV